MGNIITSDNVLPGECMDEVVMRKILRIRKERGSDPLLIFLKKSNGDKPSWKIHLFKGRNITLTSMIEGEALSDINMNGKITQSDQSAVLMTGSMHPTGTFNLEFKIFTVETTRNKFTDYVRCSMSVKDPDINFGEYIVV